MLTTPTLQMAKRHFTDHLNRMGDMVLYSADRLAFQIAIDCIDTCIALNIQQAAKQKADAEVAEAMRKLFEGSDRHAQNQIG